ncbi:hypothetical protein I79_021228 [Cricetulus griseus]|uniref:Uncharacterized protein n=1 Tax=Cricetulus griseus TaxID=10029 RepID=G3IC40_CRIGR|nr:hypothetical protein I79_021228 [Cricetulus griseus]
MKKELFARTTPSRKQLYPGIHMCRYLCLLCTKFIPQHLNFMNVLKESIWLKV